MWRESLGVATRSRLGWSRSDTARHDLAGPGSFGIGAAVVDGRGATWSTGWAQDRRSGLGPEGSVKVRRSWLGRERTDQVRSGWLRRDTQRRSRLGRAELCLSGLTQALRVTAWRSGQGADVHGAVFAARHVKTRSGRVGCGRSVKPRAEWHGRSTVMGWRIGARAARSGMVWRSRLGKGGWSTKVPARWSLSR